MTRPSYRLHGSCIFLKACMKYTCLCTDFANRCQGMHVTPFTSMPNQNLLETFAFILSSTRYWNAFKMSHSFDIGLFLLLFYHGCGEFLNVKMRRSISAHVTGFIKNCMTNNGRHSHWLAKSYQNWPCEWAIWFLIHTYINCTEYWRFGVTENDPMLQSDSSLAKKFLCENHRARIDSIVILLGMSFGGGWQWMPCTNATFHILHRGSARSGLYARLSRGRPSTPPPALSDCGKLIMSCSGTMRADAAFRDGTRSRYRRILVHNRGRVWACVCADRAEGDQGG